MDNAEQTRTASGLRRWGLPLLLIVLTFASTWYVGLGMVEHPAGHPVQLWEGAYFSLPLMAILLAHEFGHFIAARIHGVDVSPPYFIPVPIMLLGTMGAVIRMRGAIGRRDALFDIGASGPLAGFAVALPVLIYGLATSPVHAIGDPSGYIIEGRGLLYTAILYTLHGPIAEGFDVFLNPIAFAGWAGMLVTMINLIPVGQLDGGHVAYALFGERQDRYSDWVRRSLVAVCMVTTLYYGLSGLVQGHEGEQLQGDWLAGIHWLVWAGLLTVMRRMTGSEHPATGDTPLSPRRRKLAWLTLAIFVLLFMPSWIRTQ